MAGAGVNAFDANGLYVVKYTGPYHDLVDGISFLEGNSNLGDAKRLGE